MKRIVALFGLGFVAACGSTVPIAPQKSPHFDPVSAQLQLGGTMYTYVDIDGDAERAADFLIALMRDLPGLMSGQGKQQLSATGLVRLLGLHNVHAIGLSSYEDEPLYRNRSFIHHTGPREGLMKLFGSEPKELALAAIAPEGTDLVWEQQINLRVLVDIVRGLGERGVGASPEEIDAALADRLLDLDMTLGEIVERLDTTAGLILEVDEARFLQIPGESFSFPYTDFLFQVDGLGDLADAIAQAAEAEPFLRVERSAEQLVIRPAIMLPPPWNAYQPAVIKDIATDRMYIVSKPAFLARCLAQESHVSETPDFIRAFAGLPTTANAMIYLSPRLTRTMHGMLDRVIQNNGSTVFTTIARFFLPDAGFPIGWIGANTDTGLLLMSNSSSSHKSTLVTLSLAALLPVAAVFGAAQVAPATDPMPVSFD